MKKKRRKVRTFSEKISNLADIKTPSNANVREEQIIEKETQISTFKGMLELIKANWIFFIVIAVVIVAVYYKMFNAKFLNIDDMAGIVQNPKIQNMDMALKTGSAYEIYLAIIFKLFGLNSSAYHIASVTLHIINTCLVFILAYILFGKRISIITTALFLIHPVNVEAICWLSASGYLHQAIFTLIMLILHVLYIRSNNKWIYIGNTFLYGINLLIYRTPWALVAPILMIVVDQLILEKKIKWKNLLYFIPHAIFSFIYAYFFVFSAFTERATTLQRVHYLNIYSATPYLNRIPYTVEMVFRQYIYPNLLTIYHEGRVISNWEYTFMISFTLLVFYLFYYLYSKSRKSAALLISILIATLPSLSPVAIAWLIAERYLYLGTAFFCMLVAIVLVNISKHFKNKNIAVTITILLFVIYTVRTFIRTDAFVNSKNLWFATEKTSPLSYRVYNNIGDVYAEEGNYSLAIQYFFKSLQLKPDYADAVHNIGYSYMQVGDYENAKRFLLLSYQMNPYLYQSLFKLGFIEYQQGNLPQAAAYFQKSLEIQPGNPEAIQYLNVIKQQLGQ